MEFQRCSPDKSADHWSRYHVFYDLWTVAVWDNYHNNLTLIWNTLLNAVMNNWSSKYIDLMRLCVQKLTELTESFIRTVPFQLGYTERESSTPQPMGTNIDEHSLAGGYILIWPLFIAGGLRTTSLEQREWLARQLDRIATGLGNQHARSLASQLRANLTTFDASEFWTFAGARFEDEIQGEGGRFTIET
jgi:hypothetical protein